MHFLFFCFHRPPLSTVHRCPPPTVHRCPPPTAHRPLPTAHCPPLSAAVAAAVSVVSVVSARLRPSPPVLACPRLSSPVHHPSSPVHHPSSPPPFPSLAFALYPVQPLSSASAFNFSVPPSPVYPCFTPVYSCLFLSVSPSFYAPAFLALSFRPVLLVSGTACSRAFLHFVLFCYPLRASYSGVFFPRPVLHPLRASFLNLFFGHPFPCPPLRVPPLRILFLLCPSRILINAFNGSVCKEITLFLSGLKIIFIFVVLSD